MVRRCFDRFCRITARDSNMTMIWLLYRQAILIETPQSLQQLLYIQLKVQNRSENVSQSAKYNLVFFQDKSVSIKLLLCVHWGVNKILFGLTYPSSIVCNFSVNYYRLFGNCTTVCLSVRKFALNVNVMCNWPLVIKVFRTMRAHLRLEKYTLICCHLCSCN